MIKNNNENIVLTNIFNLMKTKGIRQKDLADHLGISQNAVTQWKLHRTRSYMNYIDKIAEYFNVTTDELLYANKKEIFESYLSQDEQQIVRDYRLLTSNSKTAFKEFLHALSHEIHS